MKLAASVFVGTIVCLVVASMAVAQSDAPASPAPDAPKEPTFEERLNFHQFGDDLFRTGEPSADDLRKLAAEHAIKRVVCLLDPAQVTDAEKQEAGSLGLEFQQVSIIKNPTDPREQQRVDLDAVRRLVKELAAEKSDGAVLVHCKTGHTRAGIVNFAYRVLVDNWDYAAALKEALARGLVPKEAPGIMVDLKLLGSGLDTLPDIPASDISDKDLLFPGEKVKVAGIELNVKKMGDGPPVYVVHGGPGETHTQLRPFLDPLAKDHTLIYYDQRGCGRSAKPQMSKLYTLEGLVGELDGLRQHFGHDRISIVAHSTGGAVAMMYALEHPEHVDKLVLVSVWASGEDFRQFAGLPQQTYVGKDREFVDAMEEKVRDEQGRLYNDAELRALVQVTAPYSFFGRPTPSFRRDWSRRADVSSLVLYSMARECFGTFDIRDKLSGLSSVPTLIVAGKMDIITPPSVQEGIARKIGTARFEVLDNCAHYPFVEQNDKFIDVVSTFLRGSAPAAPAASD